MAKTSGSLAASNVRWVGVAQGGRVLLQVMSTMIFSRILPPADFGLLASAMVLINLAYVLRDLGTGAAVIQRETISNEMLDTVFWLNVGFGAAIAALIAALSGTAANFFRQPELLYVLLSLCLAFPITATGTVHLMLLERQNRFRSIAAIELSSAIVGLIVALLAAWKNLGVYSLVLQLLTTAAVSTLQLWVASEWHPRFRWRQVEFMGLLGFSGNLAFFNIINYLARNMDSLLVGRILGTVSLGFYNLAYRIMLFPVQNLTWVINRALLPVYSRQQNDNAALSRIYLKTLSMIAAVSFPLMLGLWALREPFVELMLGTKWLLVASILGWFAPMACLQAVTSTVGAVLTAKGRTNSLRHLGIVNTIILVVSFVLGLQHGLMGVSAAYFFAMFLVAFLSLRTTLKVLDSRIGDFFAAVWKPALCAIFMAGVIHYFYSTFPAMPPWEQLALFIPIGAVLYTLLLGYLDPGLLGGIVEVGAGRHANRLKTWLIARKT